MKKRKLRAQLRRWERTLIAFDYEGRSTMAVSLPEAVALQRLNEPRPLFDEYLVCPGCDGTARVTIRVEQIL